MCRKTKKGLRCQICTGCGLCPGVAPAARNSPGEAARSGPEETVGEAAWSGPEETVGKAVRNSFEAVSEERVQRGSGGLHVLTEGAFMGERLPLAQKGKRLATADIGTTTIAMLLYEVDGRVADRFVEVNPQSAWGADVLSRIKAAEVPDVAAWMQKSVREVLGRGLKRFQRKLRPGEEMYLAVAANTTMTYLYMGWDTGELGHAPFEASRLSGVETETEGVRSFVLPGFSAFVGGDILAGCHACGIAEREEITLLIDLGTNGELLLGNRRRRVACATAAGPAFEGGVNRGIWGADMVKLLAVLRRENILDETGLLAEPYFEKGVRIGNVCVTREAVRSVQLAKAAIAAGIEILLDQYGISPGEVDRLVLAGGFGYYLNPEDAVEIGLLPRALVHRTAAGGNTALSGALRAGREIIASGWESARDRLEGYKRGTEIVNLAMEPEFGPRYVQHMELC